MALGGEVHDGVGLVLGEGFGECCGITQVDLLKCVIRIAVEVGKRLGVAGIRQLIEVDDGATLFFDQKAHEIGTYEAGASCD